MQNFEDAYLVNLMKLTLDYLLKDFSQHFVTCLVAFLLLLMSKR